MFDYRFKLHWRYYWSLMISVKAQRSKADYCNFDFRMSNSKSKSQAIFPREMWSIKYISQSKCTSILLTLGPMPPTGGGPRLDRRVRIQFRQVHFGVFLTSRFVPPALSSDWHTFLYFLCTFSWRHCTFSWLHCTFPLLCCTFHLLFAYFFVLFLYFFVLFHHFIRTFSFFPHILCKKKIYF